MPTNFPFVEFRVYFECDRIEMGERNEIFTCCRMMHFTKNPSWIDPWLLQEKKLDEIPQATFDEVNRGLDALQSENPLVSIVIPAFNEEQSILKTLTTLSHNRTTYATEIIVVNNNSSDRTQEVLDRLKVKSFFQPKPGWGPARQMGLENARGKYILSADADCIYPPRWIQRMTDELVKDGVTCVYGGYSFLGSPSQPRWKFSLYESMRNVIIEIRNIKRPWFNCGGASMGYIKDMALKIGFIDRKIRGEDGRMCYELAQLGKIVRLRAREVVVWTSPRTLEQDGSLMKSFSNRVVIEMTRFRSYFKKQPLHDTHSSENSKGRTELHFSKPDLKKEPENRPT